MSLSPKRCCYVHFRCQGPSHRLVRLAPPLPKDGSWAFLPSLVRPLHSFSFFFFPHLYSSIFLGGRGVGGKAREPSPPPPPKKKWRWGQVKFYPYKKRGGGKSCNNTEGGHKKFPPLKSGALKVSPCIEGGGGAQKVSDLQFLYPTPPNN